MGFVSLFWVCCRSNRHVTVDEDEHQWLIIHGRALGKLLPPLFVCVISRAGFLPEQQPQPGPCEALYSAMVFGALELRSLVAWAFRLSDGMHRNFGAVRMTRGASASHC